MTNLHIDLNKHEENCSPMEPCRTCRAMSFLQSNLSDKFSSFISILDSDAYPRYQDDDLDQKHDFDLSLRDVFDREVFDSAYRILSHAGINTLGELVVKNESELRRISNMGNVRMRQIKKLLENMDLSLSMKL